MRHFPIYIDLDGRRVVVAGGGEAALAKLRLLLKTRARLTVIAPDPAPEAPAAEPTPEAPAAEPRPSGFQFGRRDPHEKARRLARVLVSDMITYNPERHKRALDAGTIPADFEEEIKKSWAEYVEQVGREIAESTDYWTEALNEILAQGEELF